MDYIEFSDIYTPDDLSAALWRAYSLRHLVETGSVPGEAHHCTDADQVLLVSLMCTGHPDEIAEEADWAKVWYRTLLRLYAGKWHIDPWVLHRRLTGEALLKVDPALDTPYEEDDDDGF